AWLLARSPVVLPIPGTASLAHLEENLAAAAREPGGAGGPAPVADGTRTKGPRKASSLPGPFRVT
ncbi:hypothetical protein ACWDNT_33185, partial [Streptomyces sp. NPDC000963]